MEAGAGNATGQIQLRPDPFSAQANLPALGKSALLHSAAAPGRRGARPFRQGHQRPKALCIPQTPAGGHNDPGPGQVPRQCRMLHCQWKMLPLMISRWISLVPS